MIHRFIPQAYTTFDTILALNPSLMQSHVSIQDPFLQPRIIQGNDQWIFQVPVKGGRDYITP